MLVEKLSPKGVCEEVARDCDVIDSRTVFRLGDEYDKERRKFKISKDKPYVKVYTIKTKNKNNWRIIVFCNTDKYKGKESIVIAKYCYRYTQLGIQVFAPNVIEDETLRVYVAHFFHRYNERMNLGFDSMFKIIDHFFVYNTSAISTRIDKNGKEEYMEAFKDGYAFSQLEHDGQWIVTKTFIRKDMIKGDQFNIESSLKGTHEFLSNHLSSDDNSEFNKIF